MREYKIAPQLSSSISGRSVTGIFAVHGNIDAGGDRSHPGSFQDVNVDGRDRVRFLWMHNSLDPPVAVVKSIRELPRKQLPATVLEYAPEATGGVEVVREYLRTSRGDEILEGITAGAITEMSYGYDATKIDFEETEEKGMVRNIRAVKLFDISDVNWGMNPATVGVKGTSPAGLPLADHADALRASAEAFVARVAELKAIREKAGRVLSSANWERLKAHREALAAILEDMDELLVATDAAPKEVEKVQAAVVDPVGDPPTVSTLARAASLRAKARALTQLHDAMVRSRA